MKLEFTPPNDDTPGYLLRLKRALFFQDAISNGNLSADLLTDMIDYLVDFVTKPKDKNEAKEMLWNASKNQFYELLGSITGESDDPLAENPGGGG